MSGSWSGSKMLEQIDGLIEEYPPIQVLFLVHRHKASGRMTVQRMRDTISIDLRNGKVVGCLGIPGLLAANGVHGAPDADLMALVGQSIAMGSSPDEALRAASDGLGDFLAIMAGEQEGHVRFLNGHGIDGAPIALPDSIPRMLSSGLKRKRPTAFLKEQLAAMVEREVRLQLPDDTPVDTWGLTPVALRLLRVTSKNQSRKPKLRQLIRHGKDEGWQAMDLLLQLGLITLHSSSRMPPSAPEAPEPAPEPAPVDPLEALRAERKRLRAAPAWEVLGLTTSKQISDEGIDRACREASKKFHPDRFNSASARVQTIAGECFSMVMDAYNALKDEGLREEVKARLEAAERGEVYVTDRDRREAEMLYSRAQVAFRKKDYDTAQQQFDTAAAKDPSNWRYRYMQLRAAWHLKEIGGLEVAQQILDMDGPRGLTRADVIFEAAEIMMREGAAEKAYELYRQVLVLNPEHIGARRRKRLRDMRAAAEDEKQSSSGLFSGLFRRKKK